MGKIYVKKSYIDKDSVKDIESAGYEVNYSKVNNCWVIQSDEESADEITDSLRENGWTKIDKYICNPSKIQKESAIDKVLKTLVNEDRLTEMKNYDEVGEFWVVTTPTKDSELGDICFKADIKRIILQAKGGLESSEIKGIFKGQATAKNYAKKLLA